MKLINSISEKDIDIIKIEFHNYIKDKYNNSNYSINYTYHNNNLNQNISTE